MFITVFYHDDVLNGYKTGRAYTYDTQLPLKVGDKVIAPTAKNPEQRAIVAEVDVPTPPFVCKVIEKYDEKGTVAVDG